MSRMRFLLFSKNADVVGNDETRTRNCWGTVRFAVTERPHARNLAQKPCRRIADGITLSYGKEIARVFEEGTIVGAPPTARIIDTHDMPIFFNSYL